MPCNACETWVQFLPLDDAVQMAGILRYSSLDNAMADNKTRNYANGTCCVFQPFDKGDFDKRYDDVLVPAIEEAALEPYRVDRDAGTVIPVDTLHKEIRAATLCVADITTRNPNVMYELGYAIAAGKDVVIISGPNIEKYPFDIQHRGILSYAVGSISDFKELGKKLTERLNAVLERQESTTEILEASPVKESAGLQSHEYTALALLLASSDSTDDTVNPNTLKQEMRKALYSDVATRLAISRLTKLGYVTSNWEHGDFDQQWIVYSITEAGEAWLVANQAKLELRIGRPRQASNSTEIGDDDIPF
jgi:hypothetical protein